MVDESQPSDIDKTTSGVTIGDVDKGIHGSNFVGRDFIQKITQILTGDTSQQRNLRLRQYMLKLVKDHWVKGVLENLLHEVALLDLGMEVRNDVIERPWEIVLQTPDQSTYPLQPGTKIVTVFDEMGPDLLILSEPGGGKTTTLLELARDTISRAEQDSSRPIPVVFYLSSWGEKGQSITEWLVEELLSQYRIPKKIGRPWIENDELLFLFDGLDEVPSERREACVRAINDFRQEHWVPIVVCSRIADYEALTTRLNFLRNGVLLRPLTPQQVDAYLKTAGPELEAVRIALQEDASLQELTQSPFMLNIMILAYKGKSVQDLKQLDSIEDRRKHLFDAYRERMFTHARHTQGRYSPEQTIYWLTWLAQKMSQYAQSVFLIERIQPIWLQKDDQRWFYTGVVGLSNGLIGSLSFGLISGLIGIFFTSVIDGSIKGKLSGLFFWLLFCFVFYGFLGLVSGRNSLTNGIKTVETLKWSGARARKGLLFVLLSGLLWRLVWRLFGLSEVLTKELIDWLIVGLIGGGLIDGLRDVSIETKIIPNQAIWQSAKNAMVMGLSSGMLGGLLSGIAFGLYGGLNEGVIWALNSSLFFAFIGSLSGGGAATIQHLTLRFILYRNRYIPWNYEHFLDYATERIFLRKVGGGYIFTHRLLLEYFANIYSEQTEALRSKENLIKVRPSLLKAVILLQWWQGIISVLLALFGLILLFSEQSGGFETFSASIRLFITASLSFIVGDGLRRGRSWAYIFSFGLAIFIPLIFFGMMLFNISLTELLRFIVASIALFTLVFLLHSRVRTHLGIGAIKDRPFAIDVVSGLHSIIGAIFAYLAFLQFLTIPQVSDIHGAILFGFSFFAAATINFLIALGLSNGKRWAYFIDLALAIMSCLLIVPGVLAVPFIIKMLRQNILDYYYAGGEQERPPL